jgi:hypothetical protein
MDVSTTLTDLVFNKPLENTDGKSLKKLIQGKENWKDRTVYWNSYKARPNQTGDNKTSVIRIGDYKLLQFVETGKVELYNVVKISLKKMTYPYRCLKRPNPCWNNSNNLKVIATFP